MPSAELFALFLTTTVLFAFIPGPAMLYAAARTVAGGRSAGVMASLGIHLGGYAHVAAAAAGLAVLFHAVPPLYTAVKLIGAGYLVWLGVSMFRAGAGAVESRDVPAGAGRRAFAQSMAVEVLNPKTAIFFLAFLPQFVDPSTGLPVWLQFALLGTIVNVVFTLADLLCVFFAGLVVGGLRQSTKARRLLQRAGGAILVTLGARLALSRQ